MTSFAALIQAIAALLWPVGIFGTIFLFRQQIGEVLKRVTRWEGFGQKVELRTELTELQEAVASVPQPVLTSQSDALSFSDSVEKVISEILSEASKSPKIALIALSSELEKRAKRVLASTGWHGGRTNFTLSEAMAKLVQVGVVPPNIPGSIRLFSDVRNKIVHGSSASESDTLSAIDSGINLLRTLYAIPLEQNVVYHPGVDIYSDSNCTRLIPNAKGVILETTSPGGTKKTHRIFPTTRNHFKKGIRVAWEWNQDTRTQWGPAWYKDPDTNEIKQAWGGLPRIYRS